MPKSQTISYQLGEWNAWFDPSTHEFDCQHKASGTRVQGRLSFAVHNGKDDVDWGLGAGVDAGMDRLAVLDTEGNCQGYLVIDAAADALRVVVIERAAQKYHATLTFQGAAALGKNTFACRTQSPLHSEVVQMAAGPADSALNDSLFDIDSDTALTFRGASVSVATQAEAFAVELTARPDDAAANALVFEVQRDYYKGRYVPWYAPVDKKRCPSPPTGWMSWNVYFDTAGEEENLAEARVGADKLKPYGLKMWSIESWQDNSATLPVRNFHNLTLRPYGEQFPHGMKWLADEIRKLGFRPGIWTVPFGTGDEDFYCAHKDWFLHQPDGTPFCNWCGLYLLDPSQPRVRKHMEETHRTMSQDWGYEFFKIDGMSGRGPGYSAHFYERLDVQDAFDRPCAAPYVKCVAALRKGIGADRILLACQGHYTGPEPAMCDAARIGADIVSPNNAPQWHNYLDQAFTTLTQLFVHNIVWYSDPDTLLVGEFAPLPIARLAATVVGLPGQMMFAGDKLAELPPERMWLLQRCLPVCDVRPLDLFPIYDLRAVWDLKVARPFGSWDVVSLFNFDDKRAKEAGCRIADLGLDPDGKYLAFEFFSQRFLGVIEHKLAIELEPQSNALVALHPALGRPQFLSTDRHITQGATSLEALEWSDKTNTLSGKTALVANETTTLTLFAPDGYALAEAKAAAGVECAAEQHEDGVVTVKLSATRAKCAKWSVAFDRKEPQPAKLFQS